MFSGGWGRGRERAPLQPPRVDSELLKPLFVRRGPLTTLDAENVSMFCEEVLGQGKQPLPSGCPLARQEGLNAASVVGLGGGGWLAPALPPPGARCWEAAAPGSQPFGSIWGPGSCRHVVTRAVTCPLPSASASLHPSTEHTGALRTWCEQTCECICECVSYSSFAASLVLFQPLHQVLGSQ